MYIVEDKLPLFRLRRPVLLRVFLIALVATLSPAIASASVTCAKGVKQLKRTGGNEEVTWYSFATLANSEDTDWCYQRKVQLHVPQRQYINWPTGEIYKKVVVKEWTTYSCCYPGPRAEDGELEYGYSGRTIPTQVYRGSAEPTQNKTLYAIQGWLLIDKEIVHIDLELQSGFKKTYSGYQYFYNVSNISDDIGVKWQSAESKGFAKALAEKNYIYPLSMRSKLNFIDASFYSSASPKLALDNVILFNASGKEIFRTTAPAYTTK